MYVCNRLHFLFIKKKKKKMERCWHYVTLCTFIILILKSALSKHTFRLGGKQNWSSIGLCHVYTTVFTLWVLWNLLKNLRELISYDKNKSKMRIPIINCFYISYWTISKLVLLSSLWINWSVYSHSENRSKSTRNRAQLWGMFILSVA